MKKTFRLIVLLLFVVVEVSPVIFLFAGTFMENREIVSYIAPVIQKKDGYVAWRLFPVYPTLRNVVSLLLDSPEFFQMFWNSIKITGCILAGQLIVGMPVAWGLARCSFVGRKFIYMIYIVMMMMPFQVTMLSEYL
ncbi:MAG: carbohydrate ABC transporter permease, partial [Ruminococcus flavefaciens]|nr:carbohydrate ABC transporter permease [Ruminococcus flavefaciens]